MRAKEVEKVSFPQYNSKKEEGPSQDGDYTILTRPLFYVQTSSDRRFFSQNVFYQKIFEAKHLLSEDAPAVRLLPEDEKCPLPGEQQEGGFLNHECSNMFRRFSKRDFFVGFTRIFQ